MKRLLFWLGGGIRRRLLLSGLIFLAAALLTNTLAGALYTRHVIRRDAAELQAEIASRLAQEIADFIEGKVQRVATLSTLLSIYGLGNEEQRLFALLLLKNDASFTEVSILNRQGTEVLKVSERRVYLPGDLTDQSRSEKFKKVMAGDHYVSPVYTSNRAEPYVTIAVPISISANQIVGVASVEVNLRFLWQTIGNVTFARAGYAYVVDDRGNLIAHRDPSQVLKGRFLGDLAPVKRFLESRISADPNPGHEVEGITGHSVLSTYASVPNLGWAVILEEPVDIAMAELNTMVRYAFLLLGVGLIVGAGVIVWVSKRITRPIRDLRESAEILGAGNLDHQVEVKTADEIGDLAQGFNKMAAELRASYATLEEKVEHRTKELSALYAIASAVNRSLQLEAALQEAVEKITEIFHFDVTRIFLMDPDTDQYRVRASFETRPDFAGQFREIPRGLGNVSRAAASSEAIVFEDLSTDPRYPQWTHRRIAAGAGFRFWAGFPIRPKTGPPGVIVCIGFTPKRLPSDEVRLVMSIADQIAVAVENASLYREALDRAEQLSALYAITAAVSQSLDLDVILNRALQILGDTLDFETGRIFVLDDGGTLRLKGKRGVSRDPADPPSYRLGEGTIGKVAESGQTLIFEDLQSDPGHAALARSRHAVERGFRASVCCPIVAKQRVLGVLNLLGRNPRRFAPDEIELIASMARQVGVAMENAALFAEVRQKSEELEALVKVNRDVAALLDRDILLPRIAEEARKIVNVDAVSFRILEGDFLVRVGYAGKEEFADAPPKIRLGDGISTRVVREGRSIGIRDVFDDPVPSEEFRAKMKSVGYRSYLGVPVIIGRRSIGTINLFCGEAREFPAKDIALINAFAAQAAIAVENANLFAEIKKKTHELEEMNRDLEEASRAKSDFMAAMSHELRTPMNVIIGNTELLGAGFFGAVDQKQREALEKILRYAQVLLKLINDVLTLTRIEARKMSLNLSTFQVGEVIAEVQTYVAQVNGDERLAIRWDVDPNLPALTSDALKLEEILQNLIGNAVKFTVDGQIRITVRDLPERKQIQFAVSDTGIGIERGDLDKIFDQFHQLKEAHTGSYSGVGLGLNIVRNYLELMQGEIRVESEPGKGSVFTFTVPYSPAAL